MIACVGCAINPVTGRPNLVLTTAEGERQIGLEAAREVEQSVGLADDPQLAAYVETVGQRLAKESPRKDVEHHFYVVEMVEPNAFALPGGFIYVSRGLLLLTNSEDELANVIGHEIGHVAARHSVQRLSLAAPFGIVGGITGAVTGVVSDRLSNLVTGITGFAGGLVLAPYSRDQEREADRVGLGMAARAGWDPHAMSTFLSTLEREVELKQDGPRTPSFFDSHPTTPERVENTAIQAETLIRAPTRSIADGRPGYLAKLDGLIVGKNPAEGVFLENRFVHPELEFTVEFPSNWETANTRQVVAGAVPGDKAAAIVIIAGQGDDPIVGPRALDKNVEGNLLEKVERFQIGQLPAARVGLQARTEHGPTAVDLTWIAYRGLVYQIMGMSPLREHEQYGPLFSEIAQSFRPLAASEREAIQVTRLRVIRARGDETLTQLIRRTGSAWTPQEAAVANILKVETRLRHDQLVKVAVREPYASQAHR
jgi:predicted Zn-dependent protease